MTFVRSRVHFIYLLAVVFFSIGIANAAVELGSNLISNPGFDAGTTGWTMGSGTSRDTGTFHSGTGSLWLSANAAGVSINLSSLAGRKVTTTAWAKTAGADAASGGAVVEVKCLNSASKAIGYQRSRAIATNGTWVQIKLAVRVPLNAGTVKVTLLNTSAVNAAWFDDISCVYPNEILFRTMIREPNYRQTVFSGQSRKITVGAEVFASDAVPASSMAVKAELLDSAQKVISSTLPKEVLNKSWQNLGLAVPAGASGELTVRTSLISSATKSVYKQTTHKVTVSENALPKVYFDSSNRCIVDGSPFFPIGIYSDNTTAEDLDKLQSYGINTVLDTGILSRSLTEQLDFMNSLNSRNMKGIFSLSDCYNPINNETSQVNWGDWSGVSNVITGLVNANKDNPGLLAWYINDGRSDDYISQIGSTYTQIKTLDPDHPCFQTLGGIQDYSAHINISDVAGLKVYPVWQRYLDNAGAAYMPVFGSQTRVAGKVGMYSRPVWMVGESAKFPQTTTSIAPTAQQMLCEAYQAIINGARGILFSNLTNLKLDGETQWTALQTAAQNLKAITPIVLGEDVPNDQKVTSTNPNIECITRRVGEDVYILAVNTGNQSGTTFRIPAKLSSYAVESGIPGSETKQISILNGCVTEVLNPFQTRCYRIVLPLSYLKLKASPKPDFRKGSTLPRLSYWLAGPLPFDTMKELAENWGYSLSIVVEKSTITALDNPDSEISKLCALATSDPDKYPFHLIPAHYWMTYGDWNLLSSVPETAWCHTDNPGTERTRNRILWSGNADTPLGILRQAATLPAYTNGIVYKCIQSAGSKDNRPVPGGNAWWIEATNEELDASPGLRIWSPEAPTSIFEAAGKTWAEPINALKKRFPSIKTPIVINGAEYGLSVLGAYWSHWKQEPKVRSIVGQATDITTWWNYISDQKLRQEAPIAAALRGAVSDGGLYITYTVSGGGVRSSNSVWKEWEFDYAKLRAITDLPSIESYFGPGYHLSWTDKSTTELDLLSRSTNQVAQQIALGDVLSYDFISGGWRTSKNTLYAAIGSMDLSLVGNKTWNATLFPTSGVIQIETELISYSSVDAATRTLVLSERGYNGTIARAHPKDAPIYLVPDYCVSNPELYMGFLKMKYALGTIGVCQYYDDPDENDPNWVWQFQELSHVHALYSHLEDFLRNGDLLPGPDLHTWSTDLPSYEFPTGNVWTRVVVRKKNNTNDWLIVAWAQDAIERIVNVTIPTLGTVSVNARVAGSVYTATLNGTTPILTLIDTDAMKPTSGFVVN